MNLSKLERGSPAASDNPRGTRSNHCDLHRAGLIDAEGTERKGSLDISLNGNRSVVVHNQRSRDSLEHPRWALRVMTQVEDRWVPSLAEEDGVKVRYALILLAKDVV
jgi:hypothetical protein